MTEEQPRETKCYLCTSFDNKKGDCSIGMDVCNKQCPTFDLIPEKERFKGWCGEAYICDDEEQPSILQSLKELKKKCCDKYPHCQNCISFREKANIYGGNNTIKWCEFDTMLNIIEHGTKEILELTNFSYITNNKTIQTTLSME